MPFGSGLGSFRTVYAPYENPSRVNDVSVIDAQNDYAEVALELGAAGIILTAAFLAWWVATLWRIWRTAEGGPFARAAAIASVAVLVHSDIPLRTAVIAAFLAMCFGFLIPGEITRPKLKGELRPSRYIVI